ncbi:putative guanyl-specific ribonuclease [Nocardia nova SH22a]|uniref:Putative guanyl-specific ribonuclease n=1 Tax=Nocardia nova SH22a TaxID=1415166 RepID=W5TAB4_9NOCA|nr:ribonuclease domain-containing protein [Nocardia nova]AHH15908.1 putative guanyl-specific ribonuclease [Nocardia nova SH22a]
MSDKRIRILMVLGGLVVAVIVAGVLGLRGGTTNNSTASATASSSVAASATQAKPGKTAAGNAAPAAAPEHAAGVPDHAYTTLAEIDAGRWPGSANAPGTKGGDQWMNRSGDLPKTDSSGKTIRYQEWDVNPKQPGHTRDAERIVTGSDGSAYYTGDHYKTFTRMR